MTSSDLLTILHISDFHFTDRKRREQTPIVDALVADLKKLCIGHRKPDLVVFTGDLVQAAGVDSYDLAYDEFLDRVSKATGCSDERIYLLPGNHDGSREVISDYATELAEWRGLCGRSDEMESINALYDEGKFEAISQLKFADFNALEKYMGGDDRQSGRKLSNSFVNVDFIEALNIDLVSFNTAVFSAGGIDSFGDDEGSLAVPEYAVMEALKALTPNSFRIFSTHHPFAALTEATARYLEGKFAEHAHLHLFGHMHDPQPRNIVGLKGELLSDQAGAIFTARRAYYNGYSLITLDRPTGYSETLIRSYYKDREEFDDGIDVVPGGVWHPSQAARQFFRQIATPVDEVSFRRHLMGPGLARLRSEEAQPGGDGDLHGRFVEPRLVKTSIHDSGVQDGEVELEVPVSFSNVVDGDANLIIYGRAEYGRTSVLKEVRFRSLSQADKVHVPRLPVLIDFDDIGSNPSSVLKLAKGSAEEIPDGHDIEGLLKLGYVCVLVDDVRFEDARRTHVLKQFVEKYPRARYIFSSPWHSAVKMGVKVNPEMPIRFELVELRELRRNDMRKLLTNYDQCTDVETWLDRLQTEFREINLPFTAANGSILMDILAVKHNFTPINRSVLMEQFVESTLQKAAVDQSRRETFDFNNKATLLATVASWMAKNDQYTPKREDVRGEIKRYIDSIGLIVPIDDLMNEFLNARIFVTKTEDRISFRYSGVLEYFIAFHMIQDAEFKRWIFEEGRYLSYVNELQYYAGKQRNDPELMQLVMERHLAIFQAATDASEPVDFNMFDQLPIPVDKEGLTIEDTARQIAAPSATKEEKDEELEADLRDAEDRQEVFRPKVSSLEDKTVLSLILYSGLVKNMEHMADAEKRKHLRNLWGGWATVLAWSVRFAPRIAKARKFRINGVLYELNAPHGMSDTSVLKQLLLGLPHAHIRMITNALGSEKLEKQLTEPSLDEADDPKIFGLFRVGLITELRLDAIPGAVEGLIYQLRDNRYLLWSFLTHLGEMKRLDRVRNDQKAKLIPITATAMANLKGGPNKSRGDEKRRQIERLKKDQLMLTIKLKKDR